MSNSPITNQYYNNTSFSTEEQTSLQSSFLGFGQTFAIALNLFKKRISNLFLPVLIWQLLLFIAFLFVEGLLIFGITKTVPQGSGLYIPNPINPKTFEVTKEFNDAVINAMSLPGTIGLSILILLVFALYLLTSTWIDFKKSLMINDTTIKLTDNNIFLKRFWILILFLICQSIIFNVVISALDVNTTPGLNFALSVLSFIVTIMFGYLDIVTKYISNIYLIEKASFWSTFGTMIANVRKFLAGDILRHLVFMLVVIGFALVGVVIFGILGFGLLVPLIDTTTANGNTGLVLIILFSALTILGIVGVLALSWITEAFVYVAYYNLRMLYIHDVTTDYSYDSVPNIVENKLHTLEEKLMQNSDNFEVVDSQSVEQKSTTIPTIEPLAQSVDLEQTKETMDEYNLMDIQENTVEILKPEPTVINPIHNSILGIANIKNSNSTINLSNEDKEHVTATTTSPQGHQIAETPTFLKDRTQSTEIRDNLQLIEGIGPKIEELLNNKGIYSWSQLADTSVEKLNEILDNAGTRFAIHNPLNWPHQAELARDGKMEELVKLKEELNRGM
jgi:predicted flap endonuclease-1-like 5' DNA nuclease